MSGKGGGFLDDLWNKPFGGLFDFNGDGKEDFGEQWLGLMMTADALERSLRDAADSDPFDPFSDEDDSWRDDCEDGFEYGVYPEDYDTEEEYEEALEDAKFLAGASDDESDGDPPDPLSGEEDFSWRDDCEDGSEYGIDPEDRDTEEEYEEALEDAKFLAGESDSYFSGVLPPLPAEAEGDHGQLDSRKSSSPENCEAKEALTPDAAPLPPEGGDGRKPRARERIGTSRGERIAQRIAALALVAICLVPIVGVHRRIERQKEAYAQAEVRIQNGEYAGALELLEGMEDDYRNAAFLRHYAQAHIDYEQGELAGANDELELCADSMSASEVEPRGYEDFRSEVSAAYLAYQEEQEALEMERKNAEAYWELVHTGVPFVGMSESDIANTTLGAPSKVGHDTITRHDEHVVTNLYYFYKYGRMIYIARCVNGMVAAVWDRRYEELVKNAHSTSDSEASEETEEEDPLNAKDYLFPEDFYEDNWDDFYDFEEAEDYYYEHGGT